MSESTVPKRATVIDPASVEIRRGSSYPPEFAVLTAGRAKQALGNVAGLTGFGVNLVRLAPGAWSSVRHWHTHEDEFVYILEGEAVLVTDAGEQVLRAGMCAGYPAGTRDGHHMINRSDRPARYLEVGSRLEVDMPAYPDDDLAWSAEQEQYTHKDGSAY